LSQAAEPKNGCSAPLQCGIAPSASPTIPLLDRHYLAELASGQRKGFTNLHPA
jgi:hypothetical protein